MMGRQATATRELPARAKRSRRQDASEVKISAILVSETSGAIRYCEVDESGKRRETDGNDALFGSFYLRRQRLLGLIDGDDLPEKIELTLKIPAD